VRATGDPTWGNTNHVRHSVDQCSSDGEPAPVTSVQEADSAAAPRSKAYPQPGVQAPHLSGIDRESDVQADTHPHPQTVTIPVAVSKEDESQSQAVRQHVNQVEAHPHPQAVTIPDGDSVNRTRHRNGHAYRHHDGAAQQAGQPLRPARACSGEQPARAGGSVDR